MNVLWLASWYPNRKEPFNGDFIERHAKAVAPFVKSLTVISAVKDDGLALGASEIVCSKNGNITTYIIYYGRSSWGSAVEKIFSYKKYMALHRQVFDSIVKENGLPTIVHVHIAMKAGLFARELKKKYNIPYIITEQWTGYFSIARPSIFEMGFWFRKFIKAVLKDAALLLPVSDYLGQTINNKIEPIPYKVIPNVVDTSIFFPAEKEDVDALQLVHVSVMGYQKNMEAMIEALSLYQQSGGRFLMQLFGPPPPHLIELVKQKGLDKTIVFKGELNQPQLAPAMQQADALILYSRYETFGCVLIEANACGVPVIVSDFPVFHEFINENVNGVFVKGDDPAALATALSNFAMTKNKFDREQIAAVTKEKFCFDAVGKQLHQVYSSLTV